MSLVLVGCQRQADQEPIASTTGAPAQGVTPVATPAVVLEDVIEHDPRYMIGISYPPIAKKYPGLAIELKRYADAARAEVIQSVEALGTDAPAAPYDLSLAFTEVASTPQLVAIAAEGTSYTGGAHGNPLVARFVWLPQQGKRLTAAALVPDPRSWTDIAAFVREQLHAALSQRVDTDALSPADRAGVVRDAGRLIDVGTEPDVANFSQFEPVLTPDGKIAALRFVFAPYEVGPYADGNQTVDVPSELLLPRLAPAFRKLFVGG